MLVRSAWWPRERRPSSTLFASWRCCQSKEHEHCLIEAQDILIVEAPDARPDLGFRNGGYLVHHETARRAQSVALIRRDREPEERCIRLVCRKRADRDGSSCVETVVLNDDDGP